MTRFKKNRFFKKQDLDNKPEKSNEAPSEEKLASVITKETNITKEVSAKSWITSGTKYAYIIAIAALLSGIFTPFLLTNADFSNVIMGILAILVGVAGGILIFKGSTQEKSSPKLILIGLSLAVISLCLIFALGNFVPEWQIPSISS